MPNPTHLALVLLALLAGGCSSSHGTPDGAPSDAGTDSTSFPDTSISIPETCSLRFAPGTSRADQYVTDQCRPGFTGVACDCPRDPECTAQFAAGAFGTMSCDLCAEPGTCVPALSLTYRLRVYGISVPATTETGERWDTGGEAFEEGEPAEAPELYLQVAYHPMWDTLETVVIETEPIVAVLEGGSWVARFEPDTWFELPVLATDRETTIRLNVLDEDDGVRGDLVGVTEWTGVGCAYRVAGDSRNGFGATNLSCVGVLVHTEQMP